MGGEGTFVIQEGTLLEISPLKPRDQLGHILLQYCSTEVSRASGMGPGGGWLGTCKLMGFLRSPCLGFFLHNMEIREGARTGCFLVRVRATKARK